MNGPEASSSAERTQNIDLSVVVPVFNERESLTLLDAEIRRALDNVQRTAEVIYVDDGSRDGSGQLLRQLAADAATTKDHPTRVVTLRRNFGQTAAMSAGFDAAAGQVIIPLDADGQNNPADIPRLLKELDRGYDCVSGWRVARQDRGLTRRLPSQMANWLIGRVSGTQLHDTGCTLKAYRRDSLSQLRLYGDMHRFLPLYLAAQGARVTELPVDHRPRSCGVSKYGAERVLRVVCDLFLIRFLTRYATRPLQFFGRMALAGIFATVAATVLALILHCGWLTSLGISARDWAATPLPTIAAVFLVGSSLAIGLGLLAEVLMRVYYESQGRRPYRLADNDQRTPCEPSDLSDERPPGVTIYSGRFTGRREHAA